MYTFIAFRIDWNGFLNQQKNRRKLESSWKSGYRLSSGRKLIVSWWDSVRLFARRRIRNAPNASILNVHRGMWKNNFFVVACRLVSFVAFLIVFGKVLYLPHFSFIFRIVALLLGFSLKFYTVKLLANKFSERRRMKFFVFDSALQRIVATKEF